MDFITEALICKAKSILSSLCGIIILWATRLDPSPLKTPLPIHPNHRLHQPPSGLKTLIRKQKSPDHHRNASHRAGIIHSLTISSKPPSSSSLFSSNSSTFQSLTNTSSNASSILDDLIGTESGVYLSSTEEEIAGDHQYPQVRHNVSTFKQTRRKKYPPPIPLLARSGNLPSRMPWVMTRHYVEGRLIIREERVRHREYFEAHRENGRLILKLVPLDDSFTDDDDQERSDEIDEDLEFIEEEEETEEEENREEEEEKGGVIGSSTRLSNNCEPPHKRCLDDGEVIRKCLANGGGSVSPCNGNANERSGLQSASAPVCPMATVM